MFMVETLGHQLEDYFDVKLSLLLQSSQLPSLVLSWTKRLIMEWFWIYSNSREVLWRKKQKKKLGSHDNDSMPRVWTGKEDIRKITKDARAASLKILFVMVALRLEDKSDKIENVLFSSLMDGTVFVPGSQQSSVGISADPLASNIWEEVSPIRMF
ncbi:hypothetical protein IFM89_028179 [Coptis chinensis]|uniref:Sey1/RHD3-like three-helix bundle domain-containing protein n=1 Tax=Coptis chinensis TaxID=261450 RepID=A0A835LSR8_9MAGN|nr:hypothetical protein IFM89_028179 [Coptis chinensis]